MPISRSIEEFWSGQEKILKRIETQDIKKVQAEGIVKGVKNQFGYLIVFRHNPSVTQPIEEFTGKIGEVTDSITYNSVNLHTTIADYQLTDIIDSSELEKFQPENNVLERLCVSVDESLKRGIPRPTIRYNGRWLYNQSSVIIGPVERSPDIKYFNWLQEIHSRCSENNINLNSPWGAHITGARFTQSRNPEQLKQFFHLMKYPTKIEQSTPESIDVGYFKMSDKGFELTTHKRYEI